MEGFEYYTMTDRRCQSWQGQKRDSDKCVGANKAGKDKKAMKKTRRANKRFGAESFHRRHRRQMSSDPSHDPAVKRCLQRLSCLSLVLRVTRLACHSHRFWLPFVCHWSLTVTQTICLSLPITKLHCTDTTLAVHFYSCHSLWFWLPLADRYQFNNSNLLISSSPFCSTGLIGLIKIIQLVKNNNDDDDDDW